MNNLSLYHCKVNTFFRQNKRLAALLIMPCDDFHLAKKRFAILSSEFSKSCKNIDFADKTAITNASGFTLRHKKGVPLYSNLVNLKSNT